MRKVAVAAAALFAGWMAGAAPCWAGLAGLRTVGLASWYGGRAHEGRTMANGCPFHGRNLTAASRTLPLGSWVHVRNRTNGRVVTVQITDRGPYVAGRIIDVSRHAAEVLDFVAAGVVMVELERRPGHAAQAAHPVCVPQARSPAR